MNGTISNVTIADRFDNWVWCITPSIRPPTFSLFGTASGTEYKSFNWRYMSYSTYCHMSYKLGGTNFLYVQSLINFVLSHQTRREQCGIQSTGQKGVQFFIIIALVGSRSFNKHIEVVMILQGERSTFQIFDGTFYGSTTHKFKCREHLRWFTLGHNGQVLDSVETVNTQKNGVQSCGLCSCKYGKICDNTNCTFCTDELLFQITTSVVFSQSADTANEFTSWQDIFKTKTLPYIPLQSLNG